MSVFLDFEKPIAEIRARIESLHRVQAESDVDLSKQITELEKKSSATAKTIFSQLDAWQVTQLARHPMRPFTMDYVNRIFTDFHELHGDRAYSDDKAIVAGLARLNGQGVVIIGHQKGRDTNSKITRNFGMPKPEGYRKAQRIARLAERFSLPVFTFIDTPGAYPGVEAEERGQSEAIASSLYTLVELKTPVIATVIGEGGSGGALAIGIADRIIMLQYSIYSVISPEGCASILWKDSNRAQDAAKAMGLTSANLQKEGLVDTVVDEPLGGAHRDYDEMARRLKQQLEQSLEEVSGISVKELLDSRSKKLMSYGKYESL